MSAAALQEKTTHDLYMPWSLWTTVPAIPKVEKPRNSSLIVQRTKDNQNLFNEEEDQINAIKRAQQPGEMRKIGTFQSFENFWALFGKAERPTQILNRGGLYFIRADLNPEVNCPANEGGDKYFVKFDAKNTSEDDLRKIETRFMHILLTILGRNFQFCEKISGVTYESYSDEIMITIRVIKMEPEEYAIFNPNLIHVFGKKLEVHKEPIK